MAATSSLEVKLPVISAGLNGCNTVFRGHTACHSPCFNCLQGKTGFVVLQSASAMRLAMSLVSL